MTEPTTKEIGVFEVYAIYESIRIYLDEFGRDELLPAGFNLSAAEEEYVKNWFDN